MGILIKDKYEAWEKKAQARFDKLKSNEEELNKIFIELYGLEDELDYQVKDEEVSVSKAKLDRDIKSLISYAVGCMFGRYSLDEEGLIFAGGQFNISRYIKFKPVQDNVLLLTDDEYFQNDENDIMSKFIEFIITVYGQETLEENLDYIADVLPGKGTSRERIRRYFVTKFYSEHLKTYKKRPIYWQLDSGKASGVKALMYLHRYEEHFLANFRSNQVSKLREAYNSRLELRESQKLSTMNAAESAKYDKEITKVKRQLKELQDFDEKIGHLALQKTSLDLDDGIIINYDKLQRDSSNGEKYEILSIGVKAP